MKTVTLKIGKKGGRTVDVPLRVAENLADINELSRGDEKSIVRMWNRGWRIENQERSGARSAVAEGKTDEEVTQLVADFDPTTAKARTSSGGRGRGRKRHVSISVPQGAQQLSLDAFKEALAAQDVIVNFEGMGAGA